MTTRDQFLADLAAVCRKHGVQIYDDGFAADEWSAPLSEAAMTVACDPCCPNCGGVLQTVGYTDGWCPACKEYVP